MLNPIDVIVKSYSSTPQAYEWSCIEPLIVEWLHDSVDIMKLLRLLLIGKRCVNLTSSYFELVMELLHNTTAVTLCYYLEQRQWFQTLLRLTSSQSLSYQTTLNSLPSLFQTAHHREWVNLAVEVNRDQYRVLIKTIMSSFKTADYSILCQALYSFYEFSFRNALFYDAAMALDELIRQVKQRLPFDHEIKKTGGENTWSKQDLQWLMLFQIKQCDLRLILNTYLGLTFESTNSILNDSRNLEQGANNTNPTTDGTTKTGNLFEELLGAVIPLDPLTTTSTNQMSQYGGVWELIPPLTTNLVAILNDSFDVDPLIAPSSTSNKAFNINDSAYGPVQITPSYQTKFNLCQSQNQMIINFLNEPFQYYSLKVLRFFRHAISLDNAVSSTKKNSFPRDMLLTSAVCIGLAFELVYKLTHKAMGNRGHIYKDYEQSVLSKLNGALTGSDIDPMNTNPPLDNGRMAISERIDGSKTWSDLQPLDFLALAPRITTPMVHDWYGFDDEKTFLIPESNFEHDKKDTNTSNNNNNVRDIIIKPYQFNPKHPIVSLLFISFGVNPSQFYTAAASSPSSPSPSSSSSTFSSRDTKQRLINDLLTISLLTYHSSPHPTITRSISSPITTDLTSQQPQQRTLGSLNPALLSPSITNNATTLYQQPHALLGVGTHDICWLLTTSACITLHPSQLKQFTILQKQQTVALLDLESLGSDDNSLSNVNFTSEITKQHKKLQSMGLYPNLLVNENFSSEHKSFLAFLQKEYKSGEKGSHPRQIPVQYRKPSVLFLYELASYISCYPYLESFLINFQNNQLVNTFTNTNSTSLSSSSSQSTSYQSIQFKNDSSLNKNSNNDQENTFTHLVQYVSIYGHFSPSTNTSFSTNLVASSQTQYINIGSVIQSVYMARILSILPLYNKLKFSRLFSLIFGFLNEEQFNTFSAQFKAFYRDSFDKKAPSHAQDVTQKSDNTMNDNDNDNTTTTKINKRNNNVMQSSSLLDLDSWCQLLVIFFYVHLVEKRLISARLCVTDTIAARKQRKTSKAIQNGLKTDVYHIEFDQFSSTSPISPYHQQSQQQYFSLLTQYTSLQTTKRAVLNSVVSNFVQNCDLTALIQSTRQFPTPPLNLSPQTRSYLNPATFGKKRHIGPKSDQVVNDDDHGMTCPGYTTPYPTTPDIDPDHLLSSLEMQYGLSKPFLGPFNQNDIKTRENIMNDFTQAIKVIIVQYLSHLPSTILIALQQKEQRKQGEEGNDNQLFSVPLPFNFIDDGFEMAQYCSRLQMVEWLCSLHQITLHSPLELIELSFSTLFGLYRATSISLSAQDQTLNAATNAGIHVPIIHTIQMMRIFFNILNEQTYEIITQSLTEVITDQMIHSVRERIVSTIKSGIGSLSIFDMFIFNIVHNTMSTLQPNQIQEALQTLLAHTLSVENIFNKSQYDFKFPQQITRLGGSFEVGFKLIGIALPALLFPQQQQQ